MSPFMSAKDGLSAYKTRSFTLQKAANGRAKGRVLLNVNRVDLLQETMSHCHAARKPLVVKKLSVTLAINSLREFGIR